MRLSNWSNGGYDMRKERELAFGKAKAQRPAADPAAPSARLAKVLPSHSLGSRQARVCKTAERENARS
jgi:hypothetical protein